MLVGRDILYLRGVIPAPLQGEHKKGELLQPNPRFYGNRRMLWEVKTGLHTDGRLREWGGSPLQNAVVMESKLAHFRDGPGPKRGG